MDFQSYLAIGCVAITAAAFAYRLFRPRKKSGCGKGCGCDHRPSPPR